MSKKAYVIINPVAGKMKIKKAIFSLISSLSFQEYDVNVHITKSRGDATTATASEGHLYDLIVCCGGDGTLNEVISGLLRLEKEKRPLLLYFPCGSTNDFAATIGLPSKIDADTFNIDNRQILELDVGTLNGDKHFSYITSFGIFTKASFSANQKIKNKLGHFAYILQGAKELPSLSKSYKAKITYDGGVIEGEYSLVAVSNSTSAGGVLKLPEEQVKLNDGLFEILLIKGLKGAGTTLKVVRKLLSKKYDGDNITLLQTAKATIECESAPQWCTDGEYAGDLSRADVVCEKGAVRIIV